MKGVIFKALEELVIKKLGEDAWKQILEKIGYKNAPFYTLVSDVPDDKVLAAVKVACDVSNLSLQEVADLFGEYWMMEFAPRIYKGYFILSDSARDFLLKMDWVHSEAVRRMKNAKPPRFTYEWENENTLIMGYNSERNLMDIFIGLVRGVGKKFGEEMEVERIDGTNRVRIVFKGKKNS